MIDIIRDGTNLYAAGHAGFDEMGRDIVCSGVSILMNTLAANLELSEDAQDVYVRMDPGDAVIRSRGGERLFDEFCLGLRMIADAAPENVRYRD